MVRNPRVVPPARGRLLRPPAGTYTPYDYCTKKLEASRLSTLDATVRVPCTCYVYGTCTDSPHLRQYRVCSCSPQYTALVHSCRTFRRTFGFRASAGESADVNAPHGNWAMDAMGSMGHARGHGGAQPHEHAHEAQQLGHELGASAMNERKAREATCGVHARAATRTVHTGHIIASL